jgi:hypothetical protein
MRPWKILFTLIGWAILTVVIGLPVCAVLYTFSKMAAQ